MFTQQPKKLMILNILEILRKYSDETHTLTQKDIAGYLKSEYGMEADRKAIKRNLMDLVDAGYDIEYSEHNRRTRNTKTGEKEENNIITGFYLSREFTDAELRLLINCVLYFKNIPYGQGRELIRKLEHLSSIYFRNHVKHVHFMQEDATENRQLFYTIEQVDSAISEGCQITFRYASYGVDKKLHVRRDTTGRERVYLVNPYRIAAVNGRFYLICNNDKYDSISHYRLDRIMDVRVLETPVKPLSQVVGEEGLNLPKHLAEHIYMYSGENGEVRFRASRAIINDIMDWFGTDVAFEDITDKELTCVVNVNLQAMRYWAMQYVTEVTVLSPEKLRRQLQEDLRIAAEKYGVEQK